MSKPNVAFASDLVKLADVKPHLSNAEYRAILREVGSSSSALQSYRAGRAIFISGSKLAAYLTTHRKPDTSIEWFIHYSWSQSLSQKLYHCLNMRKEEWAKYFSTPKTKCPKRFDTPKDFHEIRPRYAFFKEIYPDIHKFFPSTQRKKYIECLKLIREKVDGFLQGTMVAGKRKPGILETYSPRYDIDYERMYSYFLDNCIRGIDIKTVFEKMRANKEDRERAVNSGTKEYRISSKLDLDYDIIQMDDSNIMLTDCDNIMGSVDQQLWGEELDKLLEGEDSVDVAIFKLASQYTQKKTKPWAQICEDIQHLTDRLNSGSSCSYRYHQMLERLFLKYKDLDFSFQKYDPYSKRKTAL